MNYRKQKLVVPLEKKYIDALPLLSKMKIKHALDRKIKSSKKEFTTCSQMQGKYLC